jgi:hypothetical protein
MKIALAVFGLVFGVVLILDGAFGWGLAKVIPEAPGSRNRTYVRISEVIIGANFILLAILTLSGVL